MRVLVIDSADHVTQWLDTALKAKSFNVETTDLGEEGVDRAKIYEYDCITLDLKLSDMSGYDVLRAMRAAKVRTPIIILSDLADPADKVRSLDAGADDFVIKPCHIDELIARIRAVVRRSRGFAESILQVGGITLDLVRRTVQVGNKPLKLTAKEFQILELLTLRKGLIVTKEAFLTHMYGGRDEPELKIIDVFICKLRRKLKAVSGGRHDDILQTVWGRGYMLREAA